MARNYFFVSHKMPRRSTSLSSCIITGRMEYIPFPLFPYRVPYIFYSLVVFSFFFAYLQTLMLTFYSRTATHRARTKRTGCWNGRVVLDGFNERHPLCGVREQRRHQGCSKYYITLFFAIDFAIFYLSGYFPAPWCVMFQARGRRVLFFFCGFQYISSSALLRETNEWIKNRKLDRIWIVICGQYVLRL